MVWFSGLPARTSPQHKSARRGPLGRSPGDSTRTRLVWHNAGQGWLIQPPLDCASDGGREGMGATSWAPGGGGPLPDVSSEAHAHIGALSFEGGRQPPWLTSLLTARYSKAWLIYPGHSWALLINSVPSNYSMKNRF